MKKLFAILLSAFMLMNLVSCSKGAPTDTSSAPTTSTTGSQTTEATTTSAGTSAASTTTSHAKPSTTSGVATTTTAPQNTYNPKPVTAQSLANSQYLLTQKKAYNVAYYGGSITQGTGATDEEKNSWRALTTAWLKSTYPDANITEIEAAKGGTGTYFGKMRADFELLNYNPDLVFIEFAVNDYLEKKTYEQSKENLEIIIRKCYQKNPNIDIVLVYTSTVGISTSTIYTRAFDELAKHYGLSVIHVGKALTTAGGKLTDYFTPDQVHPNNKGYKAMADEVIAQMTAMLAKAGNPTNLVAHAIPQPLKENISIGTKTYNVDDILAQNPSLKRQKPNDYCSVDSALVTKGNTVTITFKGTSIGVWWRCFDRSAIIHCMVDGQQVASKTLNNTTHYTYELADNLENTTHTFSFTYNGDTALYLPYVFVTN